MTNDKIKKQNKSIQVNSTNLRFEIWGKNNPTKRKALRVSKKTKKPIKPRKPEKKITEKTEPKKKPIKLLKKPAGSVRFWFYKQKTKKTESNRNWKKTKPNRKTRAKQKKTEPKPSKPVWTDFFPKKPNRNRSVWPGFGFFKKNSIWLLFLIKTEPNRTEPKMITPRKHNKSRSSRLYNSTSNDET